MSASDEVPASLDLTSSLSFMIGKLLLQEIKLNIDVSLKFLNMNSWKES